MVADVSGLVQMLATQPGQDMARLGQNLAKAQESFQKQKQQEFDNKRQISKDTLETALITKKLRMADLDEMAKKSDIAVPIAGKILMTKDPLARQQSFEESIPTLQGIGVTPEGIEEMRANLGNNDYWAGKVAEGLSAKDIYTLHTGTGAKPTISARKKAELVKAGVPDEQAEGIAYGTYKVITDPDTNEQKVIDLREGGKRVPKDISDAVLAQAQEEEKAPYEPKLLSGGTKVEQRLQKNVKNLSKDIGATGAPRLENTLETVEAIIANTYEKGEDLPGYGVTAMAPDWAISEQAQDLRQAAVKIFNMELAERSGAAVTKQELDRLKDEFKSGAWRTDRQFVEGVKAYRNLLEDYKQNVFAGYDDSVKSRYWNQGGVTMRGVPEEEMPEPEAPAITEDQIRADAKANNWTEEQIQSAIKQYVSQ